MNEGEQYLAAGQAVLNYVRGFTGNRVPLPSPGLLAACIRNSLAAPAPTDDRWDFDAHPGDCHPRREPDGTWTVCCRECAGTGVFPVPWINSPAEGRADMDRCSDVRCKGTGRAVIGLAAPTPTDNQHALRAALAASPAPVVCRCAPCPGRGNDGHGLTHCAECCMGTGVEVEIDCPVHGDTAYLVGYRRGREAVLAELGFCPTDLEPMPCLTCGAGL